MKDRAGKRWGKNLTPMTRWVTTKNEKWAKGCKAIRRKAGNALEKRCQHEL
jgi:hypothetical protein